MDPGQTLSRGDLLTDRAETGLSIDRPTRLMADLLRQGRFADEAMGILAVERTVRQAPGVNAG